MRGNTIDEKFHSKYCPKFVHGNTTRSPHQAKVRIANAGISSMDKHLHGLCCSKHAIKTHFRFPPIIHRAISSGDGNATYMTSHQVPQHGHYMSCD